MSIADEMKVGEVFEGDALFPGLPLLDGVQARLEEKTDTEVIFRLSWKDVYLGSVAVIRLENGDVEVEDM